MLAGTLAAAAHPQANVLIIVADDLGVDRIAAYGEHPDPGNTPVIDALAAGGLLFRNAWANPNCTGSRASLLTGRHAFRTGVGGGTPTPPPWLALEELTLAELLADTHATWAVGKWHLTEDTPPLLHPMQQGFDRHLGSPSNIKELAGETYFDYDKSVDGEIVRSTTYATTDTVDDALELIGAAEEPWFLYLCFNAPHSPVHKPPPELHSFALPDTLADAIPIHVQAMIEAMDTEIGRLLDGIDPAVKAQTLIVFLGDNGTAKTATTAPFLPEHAKNTVYEGGVNVPMIVAGPGVVEGAECDALVGITDVFATIADYLGIAQDSGTDSVSMLPYFSDPGMPSLRSWIYAERFRPDGLVPHEEWFRTVRDAQYKLIQYLEQDVDPFAPKMRELYDLTLDPFEENDLIGSPLTPEQQASLGELTLAIADVVGPWTFLGQGRAGTYGEPFLSGDGPLLAGTTASLALVNALDDAPATLFIGVTELSASFKGGTLVPSPDLLVTGLTTSAQGQLVLSTTWPADVPAGFEVYLQCWIADAAAPKGLAASTALAAITPWVSPIP